MPKSNNEKTEQEIADFTKSWLLILGEEFETEKMSLQSQVALENFLEIYLGISEQHIRRIFSESLGIDN